MLRIWNIFIEKWRNWGVFNTIYSLVNDSKTVFVQLTNVQSFHNNFYKWNMIDDNQKSLFAIGHW